MFKTSLQNKLDRLTERYDEIAVLLSDADRRRAFGEAGRHRVGSCFSEGRMCEMIEQHYRSLLARKSHVQ